MTSPLKKQLIDIPGIGETKAKELIKAGLTDVGQLLNDNFRHLLTNETILSLKYDICKRIPRQIITDFIKMLPENMFVPVGSWRRAAEYSHDIDLLSLEPLDKARDIIADIGKATSRITILGEYSAGTAKTSLVIETKPPSDPNPEFANLYDPGCYVLHVDLFKTTEEDLPTALFHYTGSKQFNIRTRAHAKRRGYMLNQYGLFRAGKKIKVSDEKEIFDILGITYKPPDKRDE